MDVEFGMPTDGLRAVSGEVAGQLLPAGRYAVLTYMGVENGVPATRQFLDWIAAQGEHPIAHASEQGEVFQARYETFLLDDRTEPDRQRWMIEIAIQVHDGVQTTARSQT